MRGMDRISWSDGMEGSTDRQYFLRGPGEPFGGPDGGAGGNGGNVFVEATASVLDLTRERYSYFAGGSTEREREREREREGGGGGGGGG